jgi:arylsulfatase
VVEATELRVDKREACRKEALAKGLGFVERLRYVEKCMH